MRVAQLQDSEWAGFDRQGIAARRQIVKTLNPLKVPFGTANGRRTPWRALSSMGRCVRSGLCGWLNFSRTTRDDSQSEQDFQWRETRSSRTRRKNASTVSSSTTTMGRLPKFHGRLCVSCHQRARKNKSHDLPFAKRCIQKFTRRGGRTSAKESQEMKPDASGLRFGPCSSLVT